MTARNLNGASLHAETPTPSAEACWLTALEQRRQHLLGQLRSLDAQGAGAAKLEQTRISLVGLAEAVAASDAADLERLRDRLDAFDAETERQLAECGGRLKRARAQLEHRRNPVARGGLPSTSDDLKVLEAELAAAEKADGAVLARRLAEREPIRQEWLAVARRGVQVGLQLLALAEPDLAALRLAQGRAAEARKELDQLNALAAMAVASADREVA